MDTGDAKTWGQRLSGYSTQVLLEAAAKESNIFAAEDEDVRWCITIPHAWNERLVVIDGQSRLSTVLLADRFLAELRTLSEEIAEEAIQGRRLRGRLRATAEQDTGLPCIVFDPESRSGSPTRHGWSWAHHTADVLEYVTTGGSTEYALRFSHDPPWSDDPLCRAEAALERVMKQVLAIRSAALAALGLLVFPACGFAWSVPPHAASPCGVLRLATPIVPGAPSLRPWPHKTTMTLAA
ncbi:hypothetical protein ACIREO_05065 [Streptomyces sp. NPDC102441]|uniref:hypothetical protein n=1 Tax=Streptomyces sp. NPDC102441 TaxID=3366176 RepID=UPI0037F30E1F